MVDPVDSQVLYAGTNDDGIWKSRDGGATWQNLGFPPSLPVYSLAIDRSPSHAVYAGTNGGGIWRSSDGGISWQSTGLSGGTVMSLAMGSAGALYASTSSAGAQVSHDGGVTWRTLDAGIAGTNKFAYGCWIDPSNGRKIFASSPAEYLNWSQDGGATWSAAGPGFTARGSRKVTFDPSNHRRTYATGTVGDGVFKSEDGGLTWTRRRFGSAAVNVITVAVDSLSPNIVYAGTQNEGLFKSADYGDTWKVVGSGLSGAITGLTSDPSKSGRLFAATATAFFVSEDNAETWTNVLNRPAWTVTIDSRAPSTVYAATRTQGVLRSLDGGRTWQDINNGLATLTIGRNAPITIDPKNSQTLLVGSERDGVFKSLDGGGHWFAVNSGLGDLSVWGLVMDPDNSSILYACGPSGVYKTLTGGEVLSGSIAVSAVVNGASYLAGPVSPDEIVVITGSGLGPGQLIVATPGNNGVYSAQLSGTTVEFNGTAASVIYVSENQVAVRVPLLSVGAAQVVVAYAGRRSAPFPLQVTQNSPGLFTLDSSGKGQAVAINRDGSINGPGKPAAAGDSVSLYGTGVLSGQGGVDVLIGGQTTSFVYGSSGGVTRFDVKIPGDILTSSSVPVLVRILQGGSTTSQAGVAIAVRQPSQTASDTSIGWATAVTTDSAGNVYFISSNTVFGADSKGVLARIAGNLHPGYAGDGGPAIDAQLFTDDLISEAPFFGMPSGLAIDSKGNLYISDGGNARVRKVSPDGIITTVAGNVTRGYSGDGGPGTAAQISNPRGLAVDAGGNLYIADTNTVRKLSAGGIISTAAPYTALGVAVDRSGNLYIGDVSRVRRVSPAGIISTVAGGGMSDPGDSGPATDASVAVQSIAIDSSGSLYIAGYGRVRKVSSDGTITAVAGNGK